MFCEFIDNDGGIIDNRLLDPIRALIYERLCQWSSKSESVKSPFVSWNGVAAPSFVFCGIRCVSNID